MKGIPYISADCWSRRPCTVWDGPEAIAACALEHTSNPDSEIGLTRSLIGILKANNGAPITAASLYACLFRNASQNQIPVYLMHASKRDHPSITLKPLNSTRSCPSPLSSARVLMSIEVNDNVNERDVKAWLLGNIPDEVLSVDIRVEGTFQSS